MHKAFCIALSLSALGVTSACHSTQSIAQDTGNEAEVARAFIGRGVELTLPKKPNYPDQLNAIQTMVAKHDGHTKALQAVLSADENRVNVVMMLANGPRIMEVEWTEFELLETRSDFAPKELSGLNILADIFLVFWPLESVEQALPDHVYVTQDVGMRLIYDDTRQIMDVRYYEKDKRGRDQYILTNFDLGYSLTIYSDAMTAK